MKKGSLGFEPKLKETILQRLRTAVGHLSAVERMVEGEEYCTDILKQIARIEGVKETTTYVVIERLV